MDLFQEKLSQTELVELFVRIAQFGVTLCLNFFPLKLILMLTDINRNNTRIMEVSSGIDENEIHMQGIVT